MLQTIDNYLSMFFTTFLNDEKPPDFKPLIDTVIMWLNAFLIPVVVIIGGLSVYKLMALGWKITHSADRPDERKIALMALMWWGLGLVLCIAAPLIVNILIPAIYHASDHRIDPIKGF